MYYAFKDASTIINTPLGAFAFAFCLMFFDYFYLFPRYWLHAALRGLAGGADGPVPSGLVIIPSLLRQPDELDAIKATIASVVKNDYPGRLVVIASIDGTTEAEVLYRSLERWVLAKQADLAPGVWLYLTGRSKRGGKPMAIEQAVQRMHELVARGEHPEFPKIYFSTDADADLGPHALERIARRLCMKNPFTGSPGRAVAGNMYVRGNAYWRGLRHFFTTEGQISIQVAREYLVANIGRYNKRPFPLSGTTGVLYCIWSDIFLQGPRFMGFMRTLRIQDWLRWWIGYPPPRFSETDAKPIPELMAGDTDDTVSAFLAIIARWEDGRFTLDAPRTPLHAAYYALRSMFVDRALRYEPEARVYTSSPTSVKALWKQRVRWNTARIEVAGRFSGAFWYHWDLGICTLGVVALMMKYVFFGLYYYVEIPFSAMQGSFVGRVLLAFSVQLAIYTLWTTMALAMNGELRKNWRLLLALPCAPLYMLVYHFWTTFTGVIHDVFLFGNVTRFAPESTLIKGRSARIALMSRVRRFCVLMIRSVVYGDVPFGLFWLGWNETRWTPSGFSGWTHGKTPSLFERLRHGAPVLAGLARRDTAPVMSLAPSRDAVRIRHVDPAIVLDGAPAGMAQVIDIAPKAASGDRRSRPSRPSMPPSGGRSRAA